MNEQKFDSSQFFQTKAGVMVGEASSLVGKGGLAGTIKVTMTTEFHIVKTLRDPSGEEITGWEYASDAGQKLVIFND